MSSAELWNRYQTLKEEYDRAVRNESHLTNQRSLYWCRQYRQLSKNLIDVIDALVASAKEKQRRREEV